jgi:hypothetical protein
VKSVVWWSIGLLFGLGLVALGLFGTGDPNSKVLCGSDEMRPGQTCDRTQYGLTTSETYEEKRQEAIDSANSFNGGGRWVTFGIGAGIAGLCGWRLVVAIRRRARQAVPGQQVGFGPPQGAGPVAQTVPGQQAGFAPPPGYAPQGYPVRQDFPQQPGYQQQPGFAPPQGFGQQPGFAPPQGVQQAPPPGYQPPRGPYQQ